MSSRNIRARLDKLAAQLGAPGQQAECKRHGQACAMGANWPIPYPGQSIDDLLDLVIVARISKGEEPRRHPRDVWATDEHVPWTAAELEQQARELEELVAAQREKNDQIEAQIRADRDQQIGEQG
ncbi:hypothetical protein PV350_35410 [Streptomyces sp. PA03-6a]|nr:hypothetical protein [Streptomyces sp. PA03-6a]